MSSQGSSAGSHAPVDREKKRKEVGALLRSCLMSSKGGVPLETVNRESMLLFRSYNNLKNLVKSA